MRARHGLAALAVTAAAASAGIATDTSSTSAPPRPFEKGPGSCGVERWSVKTLTDPAASQVDLVPQDATIGQLAATPNDSPVGREIGVETTTYRVKATIVFAKEEADSDYHLGLQDQAGNTMIAESPSPDCAVGSRVADRIAAVRSALDQRFPELAQGQVLHPNVPATVVGVGFFDRAHGQTDVAPDAIELHPVTGLSFG